MIRVLVAAVCLVFLAAPLQAGSLDDLKAANAAAEQGKADDAIVAFDKCIAADPTKAEAYYQKGVNLLGKATLQGDKMVAVPGTAEAFQKYLELVPTGGHSEEAKAMLTSIGASVETSYGTKKKTPPKKN